MLVIRLTFRALFILKKKKWVGLGLGLKVQKNLFQPGIEPAHSQMAVQLRFV
jgi:hypothetical protein